MDTSIIFVCSTGLDTPVDIPPQKP